MKPTHVHFGIGAGALLLISGLTGAWVHAASNRLEQAQAEKLKVDQPSVAVASAADEGYCSSELKPILRRVLTSCGLLKGGTARGCQPLEAKTVAALSGNDFNALFQPLAKRASIIQFEKDGSDLDDAGKALLSKTFSEQRGASYFFVVSRASPEGSTTHNRELSEKRANAVLDYLKTNMPDPDLEQEVGLLWLGEEFAQLDEEFCKWSRSRQDASCTTDDLNRSAFVAWIDCTL